MRGKLKGLSPSLDTRTSVPASFGTLILPYAGVLTLAMACGGGGGGSGGPASPQPDIAIDAIAVSPSKVTIDVGEATLFIASARNAAGHELPGTVFAWEVSDPSIASVSPNGVVTGLANGTINVRAIAGGKSGSGQLVVRRVITIVSISPGEMVEGQTAMIHGTGFDPTPSGNAVTVAGVPTAVVSATTTQIQIVVPSDCLPAGLVAVRVSAGATSAESLHPLGSNLGPVDLPVGALQWLDPAPGGCLQFSSSAGEEYLIGVLSDTEDGTRVSSLGIRAMASRSPSGNLIPATATSARPQLTSAATPTRQSELLRQHRIAEQRLREREARTLNAFGVSAVRTAARNRRLEPAAIPEVGDELTIRIPDHSADPCQSSTALTGVVRHVNESVIFVEDVLNPPGGLTESEYVELGSIYSLQIRPVLVDYFGAIPDFDGNARITVVITRWVNENAGGAIGFVSSINLFPRTTCPASNFGEYYYSVTADPSAQLGFPITVGDMRMFSEVLLAHEVTHIIQYGRRAVFPGSTAFMPAWQAEGQATLAQEAVGFRVRERATGRNYGPEVALEPSPNWHQGAFGDLFSYFGADRFFGGRIRGAPEECSFLSREGPCTGAMIYGVSWSFLRWLSDQVGPQYPGGEKQLHRAIIENGFADFRTIEQVSGRQQKELLASWAASLFVDDRSASADPFLTWASWNLYAIDASVPPSFRLQPRIPRSFPVNEDVSVRGGSSAYYMLRGSSTSLRVQSSTGGALPPEIRIWAVRLR